MTSSYLLILFPLLAGAFFLASSLIIGLRSFRVIPKPLQPAWLTMIMLVIFFLAGYLLFLIFEIQGQDFPVKELTAAVFFGGGLFVFLMTTVALRSILQIASHEQQLSLVNAELVSAYDTTIGGWGRALELRDRETSGHTERVAGMTLAIARSFGLGEEKLIHISRGALLHDIGKMAVPDSILLKDGPLTDEERLLMQQHPTHAFRMLSPIPYLQPALDIPYCHHEHWDGSGYPRGLAGQEIPLAARIFAVADNYDALVSQRRYHTAWSQEDACRHIASMAGVLFDPEVVEAFLKMEWCAGAAGPGK